MQFGLSSFGPSVIIGLGKIQSYQWFASRQQEVLFDPKTDFDVIQERCYERVTNTFSQWHERLGFQSYLTLTTQLFEKIQ